MAGLRPLIDALFNLLPQWLALPVIALLVLALIRGFYFRTRVRQVRGLARQLMRADDARRARLIRDLFVLSEGNVILLGELVREAHKRSERALLDRASAALLNLPGGPAELARVQRIEGMVAPPPDLHAHVARVSGLLDEGLHAAARDRLDEALRLHPSDPLLKRLKARLDAVDAGSEHRMG